MRAGAAERSCLTPDVELLTTLQDAQIARILKAFAAHHGVSVSALA